MSFMNGTSMNVPFMDVPYMKLHKAWWNVWYCAHVSDNNRVEAWLKRRGELDPNSSLVLPPLVPPLGIENSSSRLRRAANGDAGSTPLHSHLSPDYNNLPIKLTYTSASHTVTVVTDLREHQPERRNLLTSAGTQETSLRHIYSLK